jgi:hypothetical protein
VPEAPLPWLAAGLGILAAVVGVILVRSSGADVRTGRRLAGAPAHSLVELRDLARDDDLPKGPIRISGRVRCADPILTPDGDRLAALHRDVEVRLPDGRWRTIEHLRQAQPISVWERTASVGVDLARLAEPLISIPQVWEGAPDELGAEYRPALDRLGAVTTARATVRQLTLVDQVLVLAVAGRDAGGQLRLEPPPGGFVMSTVDLDVAMRLLAGPRRSRMVAGFVTAGVGVGLVFIGVVAAVLGQMG